MERCFHHHCVRSEFRVQPKVEIPVDEETTVRDNVQAIFSRMLLHGTILCIRLVFFASTHDGATYMLYAYSLRLQYYPFF